MNKKGYTLIEILMVIILIGILASVGVISYTSIINSTRTKLFKNYEDTFKYTVNEFLIDNRQDRMSLGSGKKYYLRDFIEGGVYYKNNPLDKIKNPYDKNDYCSNSFVLVSYKDGDKTALNYEVCLLCNKYTSNNSICK